MPRGKLDPHTIDIRQTTLLQAPSLPRQDCLGLQKVDLTDPDPPPRRLALYPLGHRAATALLSTLGQPTQATYRAQGTLDGPLGGLPSQLCHPHRQPRPDRVRLLARQRHCGHAEEDLLLGLSLVEFSDASVGFRPPSSSQKGHKRATKVLPSPVSRFTMVFCLHACLQNSAPTHESEACLNACTWYGLGSSSPTSCCSSSCFSARNGLPADVLELGRLLVTLGA